MLRPKHFASSPGDWGARTAHQRRAIIVALAEPAVVQHDQLNAQVGGRDGKAFHNLVLGHVEIHGLPAGAVHVGAHMRVGRAVASKVSARPSRRSASAAATSGASLTTMITY